MLPMLALLATVPLDVLYHSDLEGRLAVPLCAKSGTSAPDFADLVGAIERVRVDAAEHGAPEPIVLLGGDQIGPDLFVRSVLKLDGPEGASRIAAILKRARYDAVALGNHDLELDLDRLDRFATSVDALGMPLVATNLDCDAAKHEFCKYLRRDLIVERAGSKVGILAILSPKILSSLPAKNRENIAISEPLAAIREGVARVKAAGAATVILMVQLKGGSSGYSELKDLAIALGTDQAPNVIFSSGLTEGDGSTAIRLIRQDGAAPLVGSTISAAGVTRVQLSDAGLVDATFVKSDRAKADAETRNLLTPEIAKYCERYGSSISPAGIKATLSREDFIQYALSEMRRYGGAEVAILNVGFVKADPFPVAGELTKAELYRAIPYHAEIGTAKVMGGALGDLLKPALVNGRVAILGAELTGGKVTINGRALDAAREYTVATIPFIANGGDDILPSGALTLEVEDSESDVRELVQSFLESRTAEEDGDPSIDPTTDLGPPASKRLLMVGLADLGLDLSTTNISNEQTSSDPRLTRAEQRAIKAELGLVLQLRHPSHENDTKLSLKYGYARTSAEGQEPISAETDDLFMVSSIYSFRGFHSLLGSDSIFLPEPYARGLLESELTIPEVTDTQTRSWRNAELSVTGGALFTLAAKLRLRAGVGARKQLGASSDSTDPSEVLAAKARFMVEAGAVLDPVALTKVGNTPIKLEASADYFLLQPDESPEQQLRAGAKLSIPLVPLLFLTAGAELFAVERRPEESAPRAWAYSIDTTLGIRVHLDAAHQSL